MSYAIAQKYHWHHINNRFGDYPELYLLRTNLGDRIKVEVNRKNKIVRLNADTRLGQNIQSTISHSNIIREKDLNTGNYLDLEQLFGDLQIEVSSLPDTEVLRLIGGNYGILTEFLGNVESITDKSDKSASGQHSNWYELKEFILRLPRSIFRKISIWLKALWALPTLWDLFDLALVVSSSYLIYQLNYNLLFTGFFAAILATLTGAFDWLFRKKDPYIIKVLTLITPALFTVYLGLTLQ